MGGIFGVVSKQNCIDDLFLGTFYLQHRAQDYCGLAVYDGNSFKDNTHKGLLRQQFPKEKLEKLNGYSGLGIVSSDRQPVSELSGSGGMVLGFDGKIMNYQELKDDLLKKGATFSGHYAPEYISDSVLVSKIIAKEVDFKTGVESLVDKIKGDFAIIGLSEDGIYAARGWGRKPLVIGKKDGSFAVSSESNSFENTGFEILRDVKPGEILKIKEEGIETVVDLGLDPIKYGTFEWIYTAYPASVIDGRSVSESRKALGQALAKRYPVDADIVSPVPNSGRWHAIGNSQESQFPYEEVFVRYDYSDRSYTPQIQSARNLEARTKLIPMRESIKGKKIVLVDDSIVRGTQMLNRVRSLKQYGAKEVHARIACPPLLSACRYGNSTKEDKDCIARRMDIKDIQKMMELDSLEFATIDDLEHAIGKSRDELCLSCWIK